MTFVKSDKPTKSKIFKLRLNDYEESALRIAAAEEDVTRSDWVVSRIVSDDFVYNSGSEGEVESLLLALREAYVQTIRVSNNLNQMRSAKPRLALFGSESAAIFAKIGKVLDQCLATSTKIGDAASVYIDLKEKVFSNGTTQFPIRVRPSTHDPIVSKAAASNVSINALGRSVIHESRWFAFSAMPRSDIAVSGGLARTATALRESGIQLNEVVRQANADLKTGDIDLMLIVVNDLNRSSRILSLIEAELKHMVLQINGLTPFANAKTRTEERE